MDAKRGIIATIHITRQDQLTLTEVKKTVYWLQKNFSVVMFSISDKTKKEVQHYLSSQSGIETVTLPVCGAAKARQLLVAAAANAHPEVSSFQLCDFDRLATWVSSFPEELAVLAQKPIEKFEYQILGRTPKAFLSHPKAWRQTEALVNEVASEVLKLPNVDITAGSALFSASVIPYLLLPSDYRLNDGLWPRRVQQSGGILSYQACDGLMYIPTLNQSHLEDESSYQLMGRLQLAASITKSLFEEE